MMKNLVGNVWAQCLEVQDIYKTKAILDSRQQPEGVKVPTPPKAGINKKLQINYYMIDGTRIELMEEQPYDGILAPSSKGKLMKYIAKEN